jgi:excisionase family DNA binding protein
MMEDIRETRRRVVDKIITNQEQPYVLVEHAASYLNERPAHIYYLIAKRRLPAVRHQHRILIPTSDLTTYRATKALP